MRIVAERSTLAGQARVPASKSHTIRAVLLAALADGQSRLSSPLESLDTQAAVATAQAFGARLAGGDEWVVDGVAGRPRVPDDVLDVLNSGTTLYFAMGTAALCASYTVLTGDHQIRSRPAHPLLQALQALGAEAFSTRGNGQAPLVIRGPLRGGAVSIECPTSQYLSSLLLNCPLAEGDSSIEVLLLHERPYVEMTLGWLARTGLRVEREGLERFRVPGGQVPQPFSARIPADFSSATFFLGAAALTGSTLTLDGLDMDDTQGDKAVVGMLEQMGCTVQAADESLTITGGALRGAELDLNATPDALPALAVTACFAEGETRLVNVPQARLKETDRLAALYEELTRMGGQVQELADGLVIQGRPLHGATVDGRGDHRLVMAFAVAGLAAEGRTVVEGAEAVAVTFPNYVELMQSVGARMRVEHDGSR